jgi:cytochrome c
VSLAPDDIPHESRSAASRRGAAVLLTLLGLIVVAALAVYAYQQIRQDLEQERAAVAVTGGDPTRGRLYLAQFGCGGCHTIPGVDAATGQVGPDLGGIARRVYVAGVVTNTVDNLIGFIVDPRTVDDKTAMPKTGITAGQARDVVAYLYSLRQ